jgi:hypothetical protein
MACSGPYCLLPMVAVLGPGRSHHGAGANLTSDGVALRRTICARVHVARVIHGESEPVFPGALVRWSSAPGSKPAVTVSPR